MIRKHLPRTVRRAGRWAKRRIFPRGLILMYHRIAEERFDPWDLCVAPDNFGQQLEALRSNGLRIMHLRELAESVASGVVPRQSVAVTFDDGYVDNLESGRPLLEKYEIPATLFVASGYISSDREFWWDAMDRVLLEPGKLPESFEIDFEGEVRRWQLGSDAIWTDGIAESHRTWKPYKPPNTPRQRFHQEFRELLLRANPSERSRGIAELLEWAGLPATAPPTRRILDEDGLRRIAADGLVDIGGHSISHPELARLSIAEQDHELRASKERLEQVLGREVTALAYPHGSCTSDTKRLAKDAGYAFACGSQYRPVQRGVDDYELPRIPVADVSGREFRAMLGEFLPI